VHLPASFTGSLVERIRRASALPVVEGAAGVQLQAGHVVVAPGGRNVIVRSCTTNSGWQLDWAAEPVTGLDEPNIDLLMRSAARTAGRNSLGVVLSGLGSDGTTGAQMIRQHGGSVVVQDKNTAAVFSMPQSVIRSGHANAVLPLADLGDYINSFALQTRGLAASARVNPVTRPYN
jgi:two-component system chemotaxis response regulator CheB